MENGKKRNEKEVNEMRRGRMLAKSKPTKQRLT
jgi:hypothetical protein